MSATTVEEAEAIRTAQARMSPPSRFGDKAFEWLESAFQVRDKGLTYIKVDPCLDPLRSDVRFAPLVHRVGIPGS